jgi:hypothetical protein
MPFSVRGNKKDGYRLYNLEKKTLAKRTFKTREAAENMRKTYMAYDKKKVPKGSHRMPDGSIMKDNDPKMKKKVMVKTNLITNKHES